MLLLAFILLILLLCTFGKEKGAQFSKDKTDFLKVFGAIGIVLHHLYLVLNLPMLQQFWYWGPIMVGLFFFVSGYGLAYSAENKRDYLKGLIKRRVLATILPPAIIAFFFFQVTRTAVYQQIPTIDVEGFICRGDYNTILPNSWFVFVILLLYVVFYISYKGVFQNRLRLALISVFILLYIFLLKYIGFDGCWYKTILAFWMGMIFYYSDWYKMSSRKFLQFVTSVSFLIVGLVALKFLPLHIDTSYILFAVFPLLFAIIISRVNVQKIVSNGLFKFLSSISYEIYLTHGIVIFLLKEISFVNNGIVVIALTFSLTIILAKMVNFLAKGVLAVVK